MSQVRRRSRPDIRMQYGSSGEYIERDGEHEQIPESDDGDPSGEVQEGLAVRSEKTTLAHDTDSCHEPADPMCYIGLAGGSAPSTPGRRNGATPRRIGPAAGAAPAGA